MVVSYPLGHMAAMQLNQDRLRQRRVRRTVALDFCQGESRGQRPLPVSNGFGGLVRWKSKIAVS